MSDNSFSEILKEEFSMLIPENFEVSFYPPRIFLCGGLYDVHKVSNQSVRQHFIEAISGDFGDNIVMAEEFKDYFKENAYPELMAFENDIASLSSLVIVFLESAGSLVEFGIFCDNDHIKQKLMVFVPENEVSDKSSFIYLGPLEHLRRFKDGIVHIYPWPEADSSSYENIDDIVDDFKSRLELVRTSKKSFDISVNGHLALLIADIVNVAFALNASEIKVALKALRIDRKDSEISKLLYLLEKFLLIGTHDYGGTTYYHRAQGQQRRISFGRNKNGQKVEWNTLNIRLMSSYIEAKDSASRKRVRANKRIKAKWKGEA